MTASSAGRAFQFDYAFGTVPGGPATPLPGTLTLLASALGGLGLSAGVGSGRLKPPDLIFPIRLRVTRPA